MALVAMMSVTTAAIKVTDGKYVPFGMGIILLATKRHCHFKAQLYHTFKKASEIILLFSPKQLHLIDLFHLEIKVWIPSFKIWCLTFN